MFKFAIQHDGADKLTNGVHFSGRSASPQRIKVPASHPSEYSSPVLEGLRPAEPHENRRELR